MRQDTKQQDQQQRPPEGISIFGLATTAATAVAHVALSILVGGHFQFVGLLLVAIQVAVNATFSGFSPKKE